MAALICNPYTYFDDNEAWSEANAYASGQFSSVWTEATTYGAHALAQATEAVASAVVSVRLLFISVFPCASAPLAAHDSSCSLSDPHRAARLPALRLRALAEQLLSVRIALVLHMQCTARARLPRTVKTRVT